MQIQIDQARLLSELHALAKLTDAEREIAKTRADAMANVAEVARDAAGAIVERLGGRPADPSSIAAAVRSVGSLSGAA